MSANPSMNKRRAAYAALELVQRDTIVGVGTGSTVNYFIEALRESRIRLRGAVSSSSASSERLRAGGIELVELNTLDMLDLYVDGADEATRSRMLVKGGGGALTREKIVAAAAHRFVCIVDDEKIVAQLGAFPLPIEVVPMARSLVTRALERFGGHARWREGFVTDNGNHILDVQGLSIPDPVALESELNQIAGVVTVGLFARRPADALVIGSDAGVEWVR